MQLDIKFPPAARNKDPMTSHLAEQEINATGLRMSQIQVVYFLVSHHPKRTASELTKYVSGLDRYQIQRRLSDACNLSLVKKGPKRICEVTCRLAVTWEVR